MDLLWSTVLNKKHYCRMKFPALPPYTGSINNIKCDVILLNVILNVPLREAQQYLQHLHTSAWQDNSETSVWHESHEDIHAQNSLGNHLLHATLLVFATVFYWSYLMILLNWQRTEGKKNQHHNNKTGRRKLNHPKFPTLLKVTSSAGFPWRIHSLWARNSGGLDVLRLIF